MRDTDELVFACVICGEGIEDSKAIGLTAFPSEDTEAWQQWWVHPRCFKGMIIEEFRSSLREELSTLVEEE